MTDKLAEAVERVEGFLALEIDSLNPADLRTILSSLKGVCENFSQLSRDEEMGWQPIETAPKDGTQIDLWVRAFSVGDGGSMGAVDVGRYPASWWGEERQVYCNPFECRTGGEGWLYQDSPSDLLIEIGSYRATHWKPLPSPPAISVIGE